MQAAAVLAVAAAEMVTELTVARAIAVMGVGMAAETAAMVGVMAGVGT